MSLFGKEDRYLDDERESGVDPLSIVKIIGFLFAVLFVPTAAVSILIFFVFFKTTQMETESDNSAFDNNVLNTCLVLFGPTELYKYTFNYKQYIFSNRWLSIFIFNVGYSGWLLSHII